MKRKLMLILRYLLVNALINILLFWIWKKLFILEVSSVLIILQSLLWLLNLEKSNFSDSGEISRKAAERYSLLAGVILFIVALLLQ